MKILVNISNRPQCKAQGSNFEGHALIPSGLGLYGWDSTGRSEEVQGVGLVAIKI